MKLNIFSNITARRVEATANGQSFTFPDFIAGDAVTISTRFSEIVDGVRTERDLGIRSARMSLGVVDAAPNEGQWSLKVGAGASTSDNTTPLMSAAISPMALAATLEALTVVTGSLSPVTVTHTGGTSLVTFGAAGEAPGLSVQANTLSPVSFARIRARETAGSTSYELRLMQAPLATSAIPYQRELPPPPAITSVQDGGADPSGTTLWPEIQRLTIPTLFRGTFVIRYGELQKSGILDSDSTASDIAEAIRLLLAAQGYVPEVRDSGDRQFLIVFNDEESLGADIALLTVQVFDAPLGDPTFSLDLDTREVFDSLRETNPRKDCVLELEADIVPDGEDPDDEEVTAHTITLWQTPVTLRRELQWNGLAAASTIDWQRPPAPRDYVPFSTTQVLTGQQQAFSAVIGDGEATEFTLDHNLSSELAQIIVRENSTPGRILRHDEYTATIEDSDSLTITFDEAPAEDAIAVAVVAIGPESVFQSHTHSIGQITNLQDILDGLGDRVTLLEALLPRPGVAGASVSGSPAKFTLPDFGEVLADVSALGGGPTLASQIIVASEGDTPPRPPTGTDLASAIAREEEAAEAAATDPDAMPPSLIYRATVPAVGRVGKTGKDAVRGPDGAILEPELPAVEADPALWPVRTREDRWPVLLPAIEDSSISDVTALPALPSAPGAVWRYTGSDPLVLPGGAGRKSQRVATNGNFGSDGRYFYRVVRAGSTNFYHPLEMERELWRVFLGEDQFPAGSDLEVSGEIRLRLAGDFFDANARSLSRVDVAGQYILRAEAVAVSATGGLGAVSAAVVLGETRLALSQSQEAMRWQIRATRDAAGAISASWLAYRKAVAGAAFVPPVALRLRLVEFDIDDSSTDPRGQIALVMPQTRLEVRAL